MDEVQIVSFLSCITKNLNVNFNVISKKELLSTPISSLPKILIVNTFERGQKIGHWIVIFFSKTRRSGINISFYDSLGESPEFYGLEIPFHLDWKSTS